MKIKNTQQKYLSILILCISLFIFKTHSASAASAISTDSSANVSFALPATVTQGDSVDVLVNADTGGVLINSVEFVVRYDADKLTFDGYSDSNSVVKIWISPPQVADGEVSFSGIVPGGVSGLYDARGSGLSPIPLVHLLFTAKGAGTANFSFAESEILEHDGFGTPLPHDNTSASLIIKSNPNYVAVVSQPQNNIIPITSVPQRPKNLSALFWILIFIFIFILVCGVLAYKLIKYKR